MPEGAILTLFRQTFPDAGTWLVNLKRAFSVQVSPSVIFWCINTKRKQDLRGLPNTLCSSTNKQPVCYVVLWHQKGSHKSVSSTLLYRQKLKPRGMRPNMLSWKQNMSLGPDSFLGFLIQLSSQHPRMVVACPESCPSWGQSQGSSISQHMATSDGQGQDGAGIPII